MSNLYFLAQCGARNNSHHWLPAVLKRNLHCYQYHKQLQHCSGSGWRTTVTAGSILRTLSAGTSQVEDLTGLGSKRQLSSNSTNSSNYRNSLAAAALVLSRSYSSESNDQSSSPPPPTSQPSIPALMEFPQIVWPKITFTIKNWFLTNFVIRPHMDKEFDVREFDRGARQALSLISNCLSKGNLDELNGLLDSEALSKVKENADKLSVAQREMLAVNVEDIYFSFPYQIGIIIPDNQPSERWSEAKRNEDPTLPNTRPPQIRYVEITVVFHVLRGLAEQVKPSGEKKHFLEFLRQEDTKYKVMVCNYRFWRDFTEGVKDSSWIVNVVSHFLPVAETK